MLLEYAEPGALIRYAQCWEDADVLLDALAVKPGEVCVSICSGGDNTLSLLARTPARVIAVDCSAAQLACLDLRRAAYGNLDHGELLELMGARPSARRLALYQRLRPHLMRDTQIVWDARPAQIARGIGSAGRFERYMALFRRFLLPLAHGQARRLALFEPRDGAERRNFYTTRWNNRRWRGLMRAYCSRIVSAHVGREPAFFRYVRGPVAQQVLDRLERVLCELEPVMNPYLHWMVFGTYGNALPHALRPENFAVIRTALDRLELHHGSLESLLQTLPAASVHAFNLSDVFEYLSPEQTDAVYDAIARVAADGARILCWNTFVPRGRPARLADRIRPRPDVADPLARADKLFFYSALRVEEVLPP
jgi:S-adenosylmethionine-diacylglycerol 3-amino-3-carboxypropyl transferase